MVYEHANVIVAFVVSIHAQKEYETLRSETRQGIQLTEEEALRLDKIISPLIMKGQSLHHIYVNHADEIMLSERSLYTYVDSGIFTAKNIDMPRVIGMGKRKKKQDCFKVNKKCRIGRSYQDFLKFIAENPGCNIVEMDSLEGRKGGKVLLTLHFTTPQFMLAFIREANTSARPNLGDKTPYAVFASLYGEDLLRKMGAVLIPNNNVTLRPTLFKK